MTSAYGSASVGKADRSLVPYIPFDDVLKTGEEVTIDWLEEDPVALDAFNEVLEDGLSWPFEGPFDMERFAGYFLSHAAIAVRSKETGELMGFFYIKPNFPERCSHVCNGGFVTVKQHRRKGVARAMTKLYLRTAPKLGFKVSCFNLVFDTNPVLDLYLSLGFQKIGKIPGAGRLSGHDNYVDANILVYDFTEEGQ